MSMIIDSRQTYFDAEGVRLSGGRLRFYLWGTTTPATVYSDLEHTTPIIGTIQLTSAGWAPFEVYSTQDLDVRADKFIGLDEYGVESYHEVKSFRYIHGSSTGGGSGTASMAVVESIADLRELSTSFSAALVLGYHVKGDCPARTFINVSASAATDNAGTIVGSTADPTMRWIWTPDCAEIDNRTFGVIANPDTTINSQLGNYLSYCELYKKKARFVAGTYNLTNGSLTSDAAIIANQGVTLRRSPSLSGTYTLTLTNPSLEVINTFAGPGLKLILSGNGWQGTIVPITAWSTATKGYADGDAYFNLRLNNGTIPYSWDNQATYRDVILEEGTHYINTESYAFTAYELRGVGRLHYAGTTTAHFSKIRTSLLDNYVSDQMERTYETIILDTAVSLSSFSTSAHIYAEGAGAITTAGSVTCTGGISGSKRYFISGSYGINLGDFHIEAEMWADGIGLVQTYNLSNTGFLDMKGYTSNAVVSKAGKIKNGVILRVTNAATQIDLENVTVNGDVESAHITAKNCSFVYPTGNVFPNITSSEISNCAITTGAAINATNAVWTEVGVTGDLKCIGGSARWKDVSCVNALFVPDASKIFGNFSWIGGSATAISFDASQMANTGEAICFNTRIQNIAYLAGNISSVNGSTKKWAKNGHYNVAIGDNEGANTRRTYGTCDTTVATAYHSDGFLNTSRVFYFNKTGTDSVTSGRLIACSSLVAARPWFGGANLYSGETGGPFQGSLIRFGSKGSYPGVGDACSMTFEVYK